MRGFALTMGLALGAGFFLAGTDAASARSLQSVTAGGTITLCAHPNALPYASKRGDLPGLQVEIAEALAARLGVALNRGWVFNTYQLRRTGCDFVLDAIGDRGALIEVGLRPSRPYHRSGVTLAVRPDAAVASLADLGKGRRVGVQVGSLVSMRLGKDGIAVSPFAFEDEILDALAKGEIAAAAVTPGAVGWFNRQHPETPIKQIAAFENDPDLNWNVGVGMLSPDDKLRASMDAAIEALLADGTIAKLYSRYGMTAKAPE
jgi:polar amino acid transport system substrate-binding protein